MSSFVLREYQQDAVDCAINWMKKNSEPAVLELSGGSGKSLIIAEIARILFQMTGKRVLCLVPNQDLLLQNGEKMEMTGEQFSYYSASVGKSLRHQIVIATEGTWKSIASTIGDQFCAVIVDEADRVTNTFKQIIEDMKLKNDKLRVLGLTGTPFRLQDGYIYDIDLNNKKVQEATEPYYKKLIYRITCAELIAMGYLTPVVVGTIGASYNTEALKINEKTETFTSKSLAAMLDKSKTARIVNDFIEKTIDKKGVMVFATSIAHAEEICSYFKTGEFVFLHGGMSDSDRREAVRRYKSQEVKYLINVDIATVGFDAPHTDTIVLMRPTASNRLFLQIIWRAVRLYAGKDYALLLDYTNNIENLFGDSGDIFTPQIKAYGRKENEKIKVTCPECATEQEFSKRPNFDDYNENGYAVDLAGDILVPNIPAHYGRRCTNVVLKGLNRFVRCDYYWTNKQCEECGHHNDIAARVCESCKTQLIDPDEKLNDVAVVLYGEKKIKIPVNAMHVEKGKTKDGKDVINVTFEGHDAFIPVSFYPNHHNTWVARQASIFKRATKNGTLTPKHIEYTKEKKGYYQIDRFFME